MRITFFGRAAFLFEADGLRVIVDPYRSPDSGGYAPIDEPADLVVVSHENDRYHSHLGQIIPPFTVVRGLDLPPEGAVVAGVRFEAIRVFETPERLPADEVTIILFTLGEVRVAFLGDLGHALRPDEAARLRGVDIALVPAGGPPTIAYAEIPGLVAAIEPSLVVPMHYATPRINLKIQPVERFFEAIPDWPVEAVGGPAVEVDPAALAQGRRIVWLKPAR